jgi:HAE1 family hydrophobic/amphiphilic exporter-1
MKHTETALRRPVTTVVVFVAMALVGTIAARLLPLEKFPDIEFPGIFIQIPYPGSTPEEVERLITRPVEEALATLSGVEQMFSSSSEAQSQIFLQFGWDHSMGAKGIEARAKVDGIRHLLPDDVRRIFVFTGSLGDQPVLQLRISSDRDLSDSYDLLDRLLKRPLERLDGVSRVELHGVDPREIRILMKPDLLAAYGVDIAALRDLLVSSNFAVSAGKITAGDQRFSVRPSGEFSSVEEIRELVINASGLRLRDVADVELRTPERDYGRHLDREYAIGVSINKATGANLVDVTDRVIAEVDKISELPQMQGINIFALENQGEDPCVISNQCSVFAESEVVTLVNEGTELPSIIAGINISVASRLNSMVRRVGMVEDLVLTGGCSKNGGLAKALAAKLSINIAKLPQDPQLAGAVGAALIAADKAQDQG